MQIVIIADALIVTHYARTRKSCREVFIECALTPKGCLLHPFYFVIILLGYYSPFGYWSKTSASPVK